MNRERLARQSLLIVSFRQGFIGLGATPRTGIVGYAKARPDEIPSLGLRSSALPRRRERSRACPTFSGWIQSAIFGLEWPDAEDAERLKCSNQALSPDFGRRPSMSIPLPGLRQVTSREQRRLKAGTEAAQT